MNENYYYKRTLQSDYFIFLKKQLNPRDLLVVHLYYNESQSIKDIAKTMRMSEEGVYKSLDKALSRLEKMVRKSQ